MPRPAFKGLNLGGLTLLVFDSHEHDFLAPFPWHPEFQIDAIESSNDWPQQARNSPETDESGRQNCFDAEFLEHRREASQIGDPHQEWKPVDGGPEFVSGLGPFKVGDVGSPSATKTDQSMRNRPVIVLHQDQSPARPENAAELSQASFPVWNVHEHAPAVNAIEVVIWKRKLLQWTVNECG